MKKSEREKVFNKFGGKCAYCGCELVKGWHVDHIVAHWHNFSEEEAKRAKLIKGSHEIDNLFPACARCNRWKATFSIDQFRIEISKQVERLTRDSAAFRMAVDFGLVDTPPKEVIFYFETLNPPTQ